MKLNNQTKARISSIILFMGFAAGIAALRWIAPTLRLDPFTWILLVFAAGMGGASIAYMSVGEWIRAPLTKEVPHSSSPTMTEVEPKYEGWLNPLGLLLCCPICAGTWVGAGLLGLLALDYTLGYYTIVVLATAGAARLVVRLAELLEWQSRAAQERTAELNRKNALEEAARQGHASYPLVNEKPLWVVKVDEGKEDH